MLSRFTRAIVNAIRLFALWLLRIPAAERRALTLAVDAYRMRKILVRQRRAINDTIARFRGEVQEQERSLLDSVAEYDKTILRLTEDLELARSKERIAAEAFKVESNYNSLAQERWAKEAAIQVRQRVGAQPTTMEEFG